MINWEIKNGTPWLLDLPRHWKLFRVKHLFHLSKEMNEGLELDILSLTQKGIVVRDISTNEGQIATSYENYAIVKKGDLVFNPMDLVTGFVDLSNYDGVISLAYTVLRPNKHLDIDTSYYKYYFQWHYLNEIFFPFGQGVSPDHRWTLKDRTLLNFPIAYPPYEEQKNISRYLEEKLSVIQKIASIASMEAVNEYQAALIYATVTGKVKI